MYFRWAKLFDIDKENKETLDYLYQFINFYFLNIQQKLYNLPPELCQTDNKIYNKGINLHIYSLSYQQGGGYQLSIQKFLQRNLFIATGKQRAQPRHVFPFS